MHQAEKNQFDLTSELSQLLARVGGPTADLYANSTVICSFLDQLWNQCPDKSKILRIASDAFSAFTKGRSEDQRLLIQILLKKIRNENELLSEHALGWLIGHSIGMPYFDDLVELQNKFLKPNHRI